MIKLRITDTQIDYEGSITIGRKLLNGLLDEEKVTIHCLNGEQFETYVIAGSEDVKYNVAEILCKGCISLDRCKAVIKPPHYKWCQTIIQILDLCEEGVCVNGAAARKVQIGDIIEVTNQGGL